MNNRITYITNTAKISRAELFRLLGVQNLDSEKEQASSEMVQAGAYVKTIPANGLLLYLALHFYSIEKDGVIPKADLRYLARTIGCDIKTILRNIQILAEHGYISYVTPEGEKEEKNPKRYSVVINHYKEMFKTAKEGGQGYLNLTRDIFDELCKMSDNVNSLRTYIKSLIDIDNPATGYKEEGSLRKTYEEIRESLPKYCNRSVIQTAVQHAQSRSELLEVKTTRVKCIFKINPKFEIRKSLENAAREASALLRQAYEIIEDELNEKVSEYVSYYRDCFAYPPGVKLEDPEKIEIYAPTPETHQDFIQICVKYGIDAVLPKLKQLYHDITIKGQKIKNPGGYLRKLMQNEIASAAI